METTDKKYNHEDELKRIYKHYEERKHKVKAGPGKLSYVSRMRQYERTLAQIEALPLCERKLLDVGCSTGQWLVDACSNWGGKLENCIGLELRPEVVEQGKKMFSGLKLIAASADKMPFENEQFDIVHQSMMFSSVLNANFRKNIAGEMWRVLKPGGYIIWFDFICNPFNPNTIGMKKNRIRPLFPSAEWIQCKRIGVAPPIARMVSRLNERIVLWLEKLLFLNMYYLVVMQKPM
jgi:ubiquinone/menaquinone biosynthesis C-methylase UbiE